MTITNNFFVSSYMNILFTKLECFEPSCLTLKNKSKSFGLINTETREESSLLLLEWIFGI